jgi:glycosyltransferase involved in cell wall biosynthesis
MVGHIRRWKGQGVVLEALARLDEATRRKVFVVFVGPTAKSAIPYREQLLEQVAELGLSGEVSFLGERSDVAEIMNAADVVLHASTDPEPFGLVVLEGMSLGKPVVASGLGGPAEVITPGTGLTFDPHDPDALPAVMTRLVQEPELGRSLKGPALGRAAEFPISRTVAAVERVYSSLLDPGFTVEGRVVRAPRLKRRGHPAASRSGLRVALLIALAPRKRGSLEDWMLAMVGEAKRRGHRMDVFGLEPIQPEIQLELERLGGRWTPIRRLQDSWFRGIRQLRHYDVLHLTLFASRHPVSLMAYAAWPARVILVDQSSGSLPRLGPIGLLKHQLLNPLTSARVSRIVGVSDFVRARATAEMHLSPRKATTIYNGVDLGRFTAAEPNHPEGSFQVACVANLIPEKGVEIAIRAHAMLGLPHCRLVVIGDGPERARLEALTEDLGTRSQVSFLGLRDDVHLVLRQSHVCVHPATWAEAFGLTITEAMASRCPMVASDVGAIPELVVHGVTGLLVPPGDPAALAAALRRLHDDPALGSRLAANARRRVEAKFTLERCVREHIDLAEVVAAEARASVRRAEGRVAVDE